MTERVESLEERMVPLEEMAGSIDKVRKWLMRWGWILLAAIASSNVIGGPLGEVLKAVVQHATAN